VGECLIDAECGGFLAIIEMAETKYLFIFVKFIADQLDLTHD